MPPTIPRRQRLRLFGGTYPRVDDYRDGAGGYLMPDLSPTYRFCANAGGEPGAIMAVLDTGVMRDHPLIRQRFIGHFDLTGEDADDRDGHGTAVAIIAILASSVGRFLNVKVYSPEASFDEDVDRIADGIRLSMQHEARIVGLSVGDARPCGSQHDAMCIAVREALDAGVEVSVAGEARCPAECDDRVWVAAEVDPETKEVHTGAAPDFAAFTPGTFTFVPWDEWVTRSGRAEEGS